MITITTAALAAALTIANPAAAAAPLEQEAPSSPVILTTTPSTTSPSVSSTSSASPSIETPETAGLPPEPSDDQPLTTEATTDPAADTSTPVDGTAPDAETPATSTTTPDSGIGDPVFVEEPRTQLWFVVGTTPDSPKLTAGNAFAGGPQPLFIDDGTMVGWCQADVALPSEHWLWADDGLLFKGEDYAGVNGQTGVISWDFVLCGTPVAPPTDTPDVPVVPVPPVVKPDVPVTPEVPVVTPAPAPQPAGVVLATGRTTSAPTPAATLPYTGAGSMWLVPIGGGALLTGALLLAARIRSRRVHV